MAAVAKGHRREEAVVVDAVLAMSHVGKHRHLGDLAAGACGSTHQRDGHGAVCPGLGVEASLVKRGVGHEHGHGLCRVQRRPAADAQHELRAMLGAKAPGLDARSHRRVLGHAVPRHVRDAAVGKGALHVVQGAAGLCGVPSGDDEAACAQAAKLVGVLGDAVGACEQARWHEVVHGWILSNGALDSS